MAERNMEPDALNVRRVTNVHAAWTEGSERGAPGAFTIQLILSNGADEYVLRPTAEDAEVQLMLLGQSDTVYFDMDRQVLIPSNVGPGE